MSMKQEDAQAMLDAWIAANLAVTSGQSYSIGEVTVTRADLFRIRNEISYWQSVVEAYDNTARGNTSRTTLATFGDVQ